jgi:hypothetical protein
MKIEFPRLPRPADLHREAVEILIQQMGVTKAAIFLSDTFWQETDYLSLKDSLFADETVDSLYEKIVRWRNENS